MVATKMFRDAWREFDRSTAYGCKARKMPFDLAACRQAWARYCAVYKLDGTPEPTSPFASDSLA